MSAPLRLAYRSLRAGAALALGRPRPLSITCILTHHCNFRCAYCNIPDAVGDEMSADEWGRAINDFTAAGLARASFSGGEALLRRDAIEIMAHARARGLATSLNTNGWLAADRLDELAAVLDMLVVSLDGPEDIHDALRARPGSFRRALSALDGARARGLATATITVLTQANLHVTGDILALARDHGFWAYFQPAYRDCFDRSGGLDPALNPSVFADLAKQLDQARAAGLPIGASPGYSRRLARGPRFGDCARCAAGRYFATVMPDGAVAPCHLVARTSPRVDGRQHPRGFAGAFADLQSSVGPGCAISPYQESDLIFKFDPHAMGSALRRLVRPAPRGHA